MDETKAIEDIASVNKRWLKATIDNFLNETICNDHKQNPNSQCKITQTAPKEIQTLSTSDKYNLVKSTLDLLTARTTQCGTTEFNYHLNFLNIVLNLVNVNKYKVLYNYAIGLECKDTEQVRYNIGAQPIAKSIDEMQQALSTKQVTLNDEENVEKQQETLEEHEKDLGHQHEIGTLNMELTQEPVEKKDQPLSTKPLVLSYLPVINPRGRPRGKSSLVSYKRTDNKQK